MPRTARALVVRKLGEPFTLETIHLDDLRDNEALVEIFASGICRTDMHCAAGHRPVSAPAVFGHEGAGTVLEIGKNITAVKPNDKVLLSYSTCGTCNQCTTGHQAYCSQILPLNFGGKRTDGSTALSLPDGQPLFSNFFGQSSFSNLAVVNQASLVKVPADTPLDLFASLGCGLQTGAGAIFNTLNVQPENTVAVFGVRSLGLSAIMACKIRQAKETIAIDIHPSRLDLAKELGATAVIDSSEGNVMEKIKTICGSTGLNKALDCSGVPEIIETMVDSLGTRGRACSVGSNKPGTRISIDVHKLFVLGKEYVGCHQGESNPHEMAPFLIDHYRRGQFPVEKITTSYKADDYKHAFEDIESGKTVKAVLLW